MQLAVGNTCNCFICVADVKGNLADEFIISTSQEMFISQFQADRKNKTEWISEAL